MKYGALLTVAMLFLLASQVSAWGPVTHRYLCENAAVEIWGQEDVDNCLSDEKEYSDEFCDIVAGIKGKKYGEDCMSLKLGEIHPSSLPETFFDDLVEHMDYKDCPVKAKVASEWVCGDESYRPTLNLADEWFDSAAQTKDLCTRIQAFCVGANYYSDSFQSTHKVMYVSEECHEVVDRKSDEALLSGEEEWDLSSNCLLQKTVEKVGQRVPKSYRHRFTCSSLDVENALDGLIEKASLISKGEISATKSTPSTTIASTIEFAETTIVIVTPASTVTPSSTTVPKTTITLEQKQAEEKLEKINESVQKVVKIIDESKKKEEERSNAPPRRSNKLAVLVFLSFIVLVALAIVVIVQKHMKKVEKGGEKKSKAPEERRKPEPPPKVMEKQEDPDELVDTLWDQELEKESKEKPKKDIKEKPKKKKVAKKKSPKKKLMDKSKDNIQKDQDSRSTEQKDEETPQIRSRYRIPKRKGKY
ncbi:MAG: hypothetical protein ABH950_01315 [Candidatus Altiarchaeota archaeon]